MKNEKYLESIVFNSDKYVIVILYNIILLVSSISFSILYDCMIMIIIDMWHIVTMYMIVVIVIYNIETLTLNLK